MSRPDNPRARASSHRRAVAWLSGASMLAAAAWSRTRAALLIDAEGEPTREARDEVLAFLRMRLHASPGGDAAFAPATIL